jgi:hypothetical protein
MEFKIPGGMSIMIKIEVILCLINLNKLIIFFMHTVLI